MAKKKQTNKDYMDGPTKDDDYKFTSERTDDKKKKDLIIDGETLVEKKEKEEKYKKDNLNEVGAYEVDMSEKAQKEKVEPKIEETKKVDQIKGKLPVYSVAKGIIRRG